jgi:hypothetical protein
MKKLSLLFLTVFYFVCASGLYVHAHFCGGEISFVNYFALNDDQECGCGDESVDENCCKDESHFYKVNAHQDASFIDASALFLINHLAEIGTTQLFNFTFILNPVYDLNNHAPPFFLFAKASKLIVNSVFRI